MSMMQTAPCKPLIETVSSKGLGKAYITDTKIAVYDILAMLDDGMSHEAICNYFPVLEEAHIDACLAYKAQKEAE